MYGALIGGALSAAGSIYGGISASKQAKKRAKEVAAQKMKNQNWYDRRYNEDATQRADAQRILTMTEERIKQRNRAAAGTAAVMGGANENVTATQAANSKALADAASQIVALAEARKDNIEATYLQNENAYTDQLNELEDRKANAIAGAAQGVAKAAGSIAGAFDDFGNVKKEDE